MSDFNERLLKEIAHLRYLDSIGVKSERTVHCLEMLRFIRNTELGLTFEKGKTEEDNYIETSYIESEYYKSI